MCESLAFTLAGYAYPLLNEVLRMHWSERRRHMRALSWRVYEALRLDGAWGAKPLARVTVRITRASHGQLPDWDGLYGGAKHLMDTLVVATQVNPWGLGVIVDDNPGAVVNLAICPRRLPRRETVYTTVEITPTALTLEEFQALAPCPPA